MMKFIVIAVVLNFLVSMEMVYACKSEGDKGLEGFLTKKEVNFKEATIKEAVEGVLGQMGVPYIIIIPTGDEKLGKIYRENKITLKMSAGVPYEEVIRQIFICGGLPFNRNGTTWRVLTEEQASLELSDLYTRTVRITDEECKELGMLDANGDFNTEALDEWLNDDAGEAGGYSKERKTLTLRARLSKLKALDALLTLRQLRYKIPTLYSTMETDKKSDLK